MVERGDLPLQKVNELQAFIMFGAHTLPDPHVQPGLGVSRVCVSMSGHRESERPAATPLR
jgi:hypothetical protein